MIFLPCVNDCKPTQTFSRLPSAGFSLIELSIVMVIIGLIVGGILTGRDIINTSAARAQIAQIEKYNSAVNAFQSKYGGLPGDLPNPQASQFGFISRGTWAGSGDGDGYIESYWYAGACQGYLARAGETQAFWVDLTTANLIDGGFSTGSETTMVTSTITVTSTPSLSAYFPTANIGNGNYVTVWSSGGCDGMSNVATTGNFFTVSQVTSLTQGGNSDIAATTGITTAQADYIDTKIDDGYAMSGNVLAFYWDNSTYWHTGSWAPGNAITTGWPSYQPTTVGASGSLTTCYDNSGAGGPMHYSKEFKNGNLTNCALSFKMQQ